MTLSVSDQKNYKTFKNRAFLICRWSWFSSSVLSVFCFSTCCSYSVLILSWRGVLSRIQNSITNSRRKSAWYLLIYFFIYLFAYLLNFNVLDAMTSLTSYSYDIAILEVYLECEQW